MDIFTQKPYADSIRYNIKSKQKKSKFVNFFMGHREMMKLSFLHFLDLHEIFSLAVTCKHLRLLIDPLECNYRLDKKNGHHLKLIASVQ